MSSKYPYFTDEELQKKGWNFALMLYSISDSYNAISFIQDIEKCAELGVVKQYAYIYHDKDGDKPHYHICIKFCEQLRIQTFLNRFSLQNYNPNNSDIVIQKDKWLGALNYLIHNTKESKDKYQYSEDEVKSNITGTINNLRNKQDTIDIFNDIADFINESYCPTYRNVLDYCRGRGNHYVKCFINRGNNYIFSNLIKERTMGI